MLRLVCLSSFLLAVCLCSAPVRAADTVEDNREASFLPPPAALLPSVATSQTKAETTAPVPEKPAPVKEAAKPTAITPAPITPSAPVPSPPPAAQSPMPAPIEKVVEKKPASAVVPQPPAAVPTPSPVPAAPAAAVPATPPAPVVAAPPAAAVEPTPVVVTAPEPSAVTAPVAKAKPEAAIVDVPLPEVDPETVGLLSASNGGLGAGLWKETSRDFVDRLMPSVILPTSSATLNDLARRAFLTTAALPAAGEEKPKRNFVAQRIEALMALGAVPEAWKLANMSKPELVDPVTLRLLVEASLIGPESKEICDKVPSLMQVHAKTDESATEWQKSLLICKLREKDMNAVQLNIDMMREQGSKDALFLSLASKNVLGESKQLPRQLTPLRPTNLALLRQLDLPLPSELYARPDAILIPELLQAKAADEKARLSLAERAGARGILTPAQLADVFSSVSVTGQDMGAAQISTDASARSRAIAFQAARNEQGGQKRIELVQRIIANVEPSVLTGAQIRLAASLLDSLPIVTEYNASSVAVARIFALAGRPDKTLAWLKLARDAASHSPTLQTQLTESWPLFVLLGIIPDGEYAQGMKAWMAQALPGSSADGKETKEMTEKRERAGKILLLLNAAGYAVPEEGWQKVMEIVPPSKQIALSPLLSERLRQASAAGRVGETVLLSLVAAATPGTEVVLNTMTEIVRALRLVGLTAEAQSLAREVVVALSGV